MNVLGWACVVALGVLLLGAGAAVAWFVVAAVVGAWRDTKIRGAEERLERTRREIERLEMLHPYRKRPDLPWPEDELT